MKYFVYTRKSTEDEERQVLSLATQLEKAHEMFPDLEIIDLPPESASAFKPDNRPIFDDMLRRIDAGEAHGIIAWHPDRLSRNELDAAAITYRVRNNTIRDLKFGSFSFDNSPEGMMMLQMTMSQSQYFSSKLSKDVKRGNEKKIKDGWKPGWAPSGYLNTPELNKGSKVIIDDPERFPIMQKAWQMMLTGNYSVPEVLDKLNGEWGFRTRKTRKMGDMPLSRSALYGIFTNPFYAGLIRYNGNVTSGSHNAMITVAEFDKVQTMLGNKGRPRPQVYDFTYRGGMVCGECGCSITAEKKYKLIRSTGLTKEYIYYHCTHKRTCSQGSISEEELVKQVDTVLTTITIDPDFRDWAIEALKSSTANEVADRTALMKSQNAAILTTQEQINRLTKMRLSDLLTDEEYVEQRERLSGELNRLREGLRDLESRADKWLELTEQVFDFASSAKRVFANGTDEEKRQVFLSLSNNVTLLNGKLDIELHPWFIPIQQKYPSIERAFDEVRTANSAVSKELVMANSDQNSIWLRQLGSNQRHPR